MTRRPLSAMPGHALALQIRQVRADRADAHRIAVYMRLRESVNPRARIALLSGVAGGGNILSPGQGPGKGSRA